jgi:hypothetical protein
VRAASTSDPTTLHAADAIQQRQRSAITDLMCFGLGGKSGFGPPYANFLTPSHANLALFVKVAHSLSAFSGMQRASFFPTRPGEVALNWGRNVSLADSRSFGKKKLTGDRMETRDEKTRLEPLDTRIHRRVPRTKVQAKVNQTRKIAWTTRPGAFDRRRKRLR